MESEPDPTNAISQLILIGILTFINAFFSATEMAIVSLNRNKIRMLSEEGNKKAQMLEKLMLEPTKFLSTIQVGITFASFFSSAFAATGMSGDLAVFFRKYNIAYSDEIALVIVTVVLAYVTLLFGELYPKRIALQKAEAIAMFSVRPIVFVSKITMPFIRFLAVSTNFLIRITGMKVDGLEEKISKEEIRSLVEVGEEHGVINETEKEMINSIFEFDDKLADEVMTARTDVYLININKPLSTYLDDLLRENYSRIPVYEDDVDNIIGVLYMKDFVNEAYKYGFENVDIRKILQEPYFVPETKNIDILFKELKAAKVHMAILIDEYGGFSGVVTIEDLIEEVMGDIDDEYDDYEPEIRKIDNNTYIANGLLSIDDLNDFLDINLVSEDCDTISGFLINILGKIPEETEKRTIEYENILFKIEKVKEKRIEEIKIILPE